MGKFLKFGQPKSPRRTRANHSGKISILIISDNLSNVKGEIMVEYVSECVGCPMEKGCVGRTCPYINVPHYLCDICKCEYELTELIEYDGNTLCHDCLFNKFPHGDCDAEILCDVCGDGAYGDELVDICGRMLCKYCLAKILG